uniref:Protein F37C4.5 n=1 Tax=Caenorhabditis japonica TaxID=281687 RepID=A0A8R1DWZ8_CAEJA
MPETNVLELQLRDQPISQVKVFTDRAEICRTFKVSLKKGVNEVVLNNLSNSTIGGSLRVEGKGKATIHDVVIKNRAALREVIDNKQVATLRANLQDEIACLQSIVDRKSIVEKSIANLDKVLESVGSGHVTAPKEGGSVALTEETLESLTKFFDFYAINSENYRKKCREIEKEHKFQQEKVEKVEQELNLLESQKRNKYFYEAASITLECCDDDTEIELVVVYQVLNAGWSPSYDIRVDTEKPSMNINYFGKIRQQTNEDWDSCPLILSTAQPCLGGKIPELGTLDAVFYSRREIHQGPGQMTRTQFGLFGGAQPQLARAFGSVTNSATLPPEPPLEVAVASEIKQNTLSTEFKILREATIPHGTTDHKVTIAMVTLSPRLVHESVPSKNASVFLTASAINNSDLAFLVGDSNVYLNNAFIAKSHLKNVSPGEKFTCSLGVDTAIRVENKPAKKYHEEGGYITKHSSNVTEQIISLKNTRREQPVLLTIKHHVPRSTDEKIRVKLIHPHATTPDTEKANSETENVEPAEGAMINSSNNLEWTVKLAPNSSQDLKIQYVVEHPKDQTVQFLERF